MPPQCSDASSEAKFKDLKRQYPSHTFSSTPLCKVFELDSSIFEDFSGLGAQRKETLQASLDDLLSCTKTASSRADMLQILFTRLIVATAKLHACSGVLWGHSNSRLAAKALSNIAKGRGSYLPFDLADRQSPWGITFYHPLRDLFKPELVTYAAELPHSFLKLIELYPDPAAAPLPIRAISIDDLMSAYIDGQGEKYPSIMANVVRTAGKLQAPRITSATLMCPICRMPAPGIGAAQETGESKNCYACQRLKLEMRSHSNT